MAGAEDEARLQHCLETIIRVVEETMKKLTGQEESGRFSMDGALDTNIYTFTLDAQEEALMEEMKIELEDVLRQTVTRLSTLCRTYLLDFLYQHSYDYESREFTNPFNSGILKAFVNDAQQMLASLKAFLAAFDGNEGDVKAFLKRFPTMKDRPGLWGTTLLYSAARNNHTNLVRFLVTNARCSVNAQNQQHIKRALSKSVKDDPDFVPNPSAGSTALHGACFAGHLEIVKFLFEHGADCFLRNHAYETPIDNGRRKPSIIKYFMENLILSYSIKTNELPHLPIREEDEDYVVDCFWEYKPFKEQKWFPFSESESETLQGSLIVKPEQKFKREIHLRVRAGTYTVSLIQFLRSGKDADFTQRIAWIRCRGSSILNFSCYCLWQIMFTKYPKAETEPSLMMLTIPTVYDSNFKVHLDSWYFCDAKTSAQLDHTMNYRRKHICLELSRVCHDKLLFDLQTFSFNSENGSVTGFIRWIPKMISNNSRNKNKIIGIDDFQTLANLDPIPLTTARLRQVLQKDDRMSIADDNELLENKEEYDFDTEAGDIEDNEDKYKAMNEAPTTPINQSWSIQDLADGERDSQLGSSASSTTISKSDASDDLGDKRMDDFINEAAAKVRSSQQNRLEEKVTSNTSDDDKNSAATKIQLSELEKKNDKLKQDLQNEQRRIEKLLDSGSKHEQEVARLLDQIAKMEGQQKENERQQAKLRDMDRNIKTVDYNNIQHEVIHRFLTPKDSLIIRYLQDLVKHLDPSFNDRAPKIIFAGKNNQYVVTVVGFPAHHQGFKDVLQRIWSLTNVIESAKVQLPLYESSKDLLDKIEKNAVTTISTSTGSGKSTLLPVLLIAEGYDKVIVTQPRRLPCQLICKRVNETMANESGPMKDPLAGWAVSGTEKNPNAGILYLTDGLLKERLLYDSNLISTNTKFNKSVVFFVDEVHERSVNIDLCLALLARSLSIQPELKTKMKVIISSATLDASVPTLFRHIPQVGLAEFKMPQMGTLHPVTKIARPNENALDIVQELCKKRKRHDQILCFVSSVGEVNQSCKLINQISQETIVAYPLIQSQHPNVQQYNIEYGSVFFSTTVAETSLTFPCLKYVVDTGMINVPVYDFDSKRTVLREVRAAESTIKQRLGRLGRTQPGEYYSLYDFKVDAVPYPVPQICQSDLMNIEFSLRKSPLKKGFNYMKSFLPNKPSQKAIDTTIGQLKDLNILEKGSNDKLTKHGDELAKLPDFGSLAMSKAVLAALRNHGCGRDLICLSAILGVLNTTTLFKSLPQHLKSPDGDFMTLLKVMDEILLVRQSSPAKQFNVDQVCQSKGLKEIQHIIRQALRRYQTLEKTFNQSPDFCARAQEQSGDWELVARSLLAGYSDNVFVSMKELQDRSHLFIRYNNGGDIAKLDLQSTLTRPISTAPVSLVLARDIRHSTAVRATAIISFVGEIKAEWLECPLEREFDLTNEEEIYLNAANRYSGAQTKFSNKINMSLGGQKMKFKGSSGIVLNAELHLRQQMISELKFNLSNTPNPADNLNFARNLESIMKMTHIFNPMKWRWATERQVEITINSNTATKTCEIIVKGRDSDNKKVKKEFDVFIGWLRKCAVIRHPNDHVSPRVLRPAMRKDCRDIEERISRVTDTKRTPVDLYKGVRGSKATRETRMEVVAWISVCKFDCKVEGGFVRDWIVDHYTARPSGVTDPKKWIDMSNPMPALVKEVIPCDLDCHLPSHMYFDIEKFQDELYKYGITCEVKRDNWRYVLLFDENEPTGPFTMDLIEPHVALTHDRIDLDVNNLSVEKDYTHELGMRIDIQRKPYEIELEKIVNNIKNKRFKVLRPLDQFVKQRIEKMQQRGWTQDGPIISVIPDPHYKYYAVLVPLPSSATLYTDVSTKMKNITSVQIVSIEEIRNPYLEETYEGMKKLIAKQCPNQIPNEQELFHGTKTAGIEGITEDGYDDRYFNKGGLYGHGAYFADDPNKSHGYTELNAANGTHVMFYNKVLLGKPTILTATDNTLVSAPHGFHSVIGKHTAMTEYIVYRYGQALPYLKIVYKA
ncbi:unnamed protein product [Rotaria sordida]|uniref:Poly [ADP-ribose] polymerase n=2 Tax=Rotaria sordida TaxID=392033 RepID=A0A814BGP1_9BILA|nr:unnamed protein product [Rotaria sordida]CAF0979222.1 unnamed protein product [Rotaria sordida]